MNERPVIIFDLGKVLVDFDYSIAARQLAARSAKAPADLHANRRWQETVARIAALSAVPPLVLTEGES